MLRFGEKPLENVLANTNNNKMNEWPGAPIKDSLSV